jgi:hypothetical protein
MRYNDLTEFSDLPYDITQFSEHDGICTLNGMIPIPVDAVSFSYAGDEDIEIYDERGNYLGVLCICKTITGINIENLTEARYIAFINEIDKDSFRFLELPYKFIKNYLVIDVCEYDDYKNKYMDSAPIWGGFFHSNAESNLQEAYRFKPSQLIARPGIELPTRYHKESSMRSVVQPYAFERFLKLYHLLELIFDWKLVEKIKSLNDDLQGIGQLLNQYSNTKEFERLKILLKDKDKEGRLDVDKIANCLNRIKSSNYLAKGIEIFFDYGKEGNPYKIDPFVDLMNRGGFTRSNSRDKSIKGISENNYDDLVINFSAYCIYRVRCCTAHNRIGEYVMSNDDEGFVVEFAEPLLREVLCQIFSE